MPNSKPPNGEAFWAEAVRLTHEPGNKITSVARDLGVSMEGLRQQRPPGRDRGRTSAGLTSDERAELVRLRRENRTLRTEREILKKAAALLRARDQRDPGTVPRFVARERACFPVTTMCRVLGVSSSGYGAWWNRPPSRRARADAVLSARIS